MFADWLLSKYEEWREGKYGREASQAEFARYLDINYQSINEYLHNKSSPAHEEVIDKLRAKYGDEALIALGREPQPRDRIIHIIDQRTQEEQQQILKELIDRYDIELTYLKLEENRNGPEGKQ